MYFNRLKIYVIFFKTLNTDAKSYPVCLKMKRIQVRFSVLQWLLWKLVNVYHADIIIIRYFSDEKGMSPQLNDFEYSSHENAMW